MKKMSKAASKKTKGGKMVTAPVIGGGPRSILQRVEAMESTMKELDRMIKESQEARYAEIIRNFHKNSGVGLKSNRWLDEAKKIKFK